MVTGVIGFFVGGIAGAVMTAYSNPDASFEDILYGGLRGAVVGGVAGLTAGASTALLAGAANAAGASSAVMAAAGLSGGVLGAAGGDVAGQYVGWGMDRATGRGPTAQAESFGAAYSWKQTALAAAGGVFNAGLGQAWSQAARAAGRQAAGATTQATGQAVAGQAARTGAAQLGGYAMPVTLGAAGGFVSDVAGQWAEKGWSGIDWGQAGLSAAFGAAGGAGNRALGGWALNNYHKHGTARSRVAQVLAFDAKRLGLNVCFAAEVPLLVPGGSRRIADIQVGELVLARDEGDPDGAVEAKVVEEVFRRTGRVLHLHVGGQVIRTSAEHPFWVRGAGWVAAGLLRPGDLLSSHDGQWVAVEETCDTGEYETVYNLRVADFHTYFVGCHDWGFSAWAHNQCLANYLSPDEITALANDVRDRSRAQGSNGGRAQAWLKHEYALPDGQPLSKTNRATILELAKQPGADGTQFNFDGVRGPRTNTMPVELQTQNRARVAVQGLLEGPEFPQLDPRGGGSRRTTTGGIENLPEQAIPGSGSGVRSPDHTVFGQLTPELAAQLSQRLGQVVQAELGAGPLVGSVRVYGNAMAAPGDFAINIGPVKGNGTPTPKEMSQIRSYRASGISVIHVSYGGGS